MVLSSDELSKTLFTEIWPTLRLPVKSHMTLTLSCLIITIISTEMSYTNIPGVPLWSTIRSIKVTHELRRFWWSNCLSGLSQVKNVATGGVVSHRLPLVTLLSDEALPLMNSELWTMYILPFSRLWEEDQSQNFVTEPSASLPFSLGVLTFSEFFVRVMGFLPPFLLSNKSRVIMLFVWLPVIFLWGI